MDQGVRTWGDVRLVLAAAVLASLGLLVQVYRQSQPADGGLGQGVESAAYEKIVPLWTWAVGSSKSLLRLDWYR